MSREILTRQVVISGRVIDAISSGVPRSALRIDVVNDADGKPASTLMVRVLPDARFAVFGDPNEIRAETDTDLRLEVGADGYSSGSAVISFTAAELALVNRSLDVAGEVNLVPVIGGLPREQNMVLSPLPVVLKGRVSEADNPENPIAGASISVTAPTAVGPASSDADGFFTIGPLPVAPAITVSATAAGKQPLSRTITLDFSKPTNRASLPLEPI